MTELQDFVEKKAKLSSKGELDHESFKNEESDYLYFNSRDLIIECLNNELFYVKDVESLLLRLPKLWSDFSLDDWKHVIRNVARKPDYRYMFDSEPCFVDIKFLYKYLEVDSIKLYKEDTELSEESKASITKAVSVFCFQFFKDEYDLETIQDEPAFKKAKDRLLSEGASEASFKTDEMMETDAFRGYIRGGTAV